MNVRFVSLSVICTVIVVFMLFSATSEISARSDRQGEVIEPVKSIVIVDDIVMSKAVGKCKYKKEDPNEAQQGWKLAGEAPTAKQNFYGASNFNIALKESGQPDSLNHGFSDPSGIIGKDGDRYKKKFFFYTSTRSSGHHFPSFGIFKAWIRDGNLKFMYVIKKANEGGKMMNMDGFDTIRQETAGGEKIEKSVNLEGALQVGGEAHGAAFQSEMKAKKTGLKVKISQ